MLNQLTYLKERELFSKHTISGEYNRHSKLTLKQALALNTLIKTGLYTLKIAAVIRSLLLFHNRSQKSSFNFQIE